jgi:hypothetical protein
MSYSWVGAPTEFNGTNAETGGDSSEYPKVYITSVTAHVKMHQRHTFDAISIILSTYHRTLS